MPVGALVNKHKHKQVAMHTLPLDLESTISIILLLAFVLIAAVGSRQDLRSKAFDSVEHGRLLEKLGWYGIDQGWFRAWLSGRTQTVKGVSCLELPVSHGIVQGSILGPVLFLLYTNDLPQHMPHGKTVMYADDAQFLDCDTPQNIPDLKKRVEHSRSVALDWFSQNKLKINPSKTEFTILKSRRL